MRALTDAAILNMLVSALEVEPSTAGTPTMEIPDFIKENIVPRKPLARQRVEGDPLIKARVDSVVRPPQVGDRYGQWKLLSLHYHSSQSKGPSCLLRCQCGTLKVEKIRALASLKPKSCGCARPSA